MLARSLLCPAAEVRQRQAAFTMAAPSVPQHVYRVAWVHERDQTRNSDAPKPLASRACFKGTSSISGPTASIAAQESWTCLAVGILALTVSHERSRVAIAKAAGRIPCAAGRACAKQMLTRILQSRVLSWALGMRSLLGDSSPQRSPVHAPPKPRPRQLGRAQLYSTEKKRIPEGATREEEE